MQIKVINKKNDKTIEDISDSGKKIYTLVWYNLVEKDMIIISEYIYINLDVEIKFKKNSKEKKIVLIGEYNNKFWFFKIIKEGNSQSLAFSAKRPNNNFIDNINIAIVDWSNSISKLNINDANIEYAVGKVI